MRVLGAQPAELESVENVGLVVPNELLNFKYLFLYISTVITKLFCTVLLGSMCIDLLNVYA